MTVCLFVQFVPLFAVYYGATRNGAYLWLVCCAQLLGYFSTISNVIIYYMRNTAFKQAAKRVIVSIIPCYGTPVIPLND